MLNQPSLMVSHNQYTILFRYCTVTQTPPILCNKCKLCTCIETINITNQSVISGAELLPSMDYVSQKSVNLHQLRSYGQVIPFP